MIGKEVKIYAGEILDYNSISHMKDRTRLTEHLKKITYGIKNER